MGRGLAPENHWHQANGDRVMLLKEFCTTEVAYCSRDTTVAEAAQIMRRKHVGDLVIVDDPDEDFSPVGLITDRDIVVKVLGNELDPRKTAVGEIMQTPLVTASEDEDSSIAIGRMRNHGVRRLPVTRGHGKLAGIVTLDDLLRRLRFEVDALLDVVSKERDHERREIR
jgi:CBS domain-containing protein